MKISATFFFSLILLMSCAQNEPVPVEVVTDSLDVPEVEQKSLQTILSENNISKSNLLIKIDKTAYTLSVLNKDTVLITYPCVFGFNPVDDKMQEGDGATPEGTFGIRSMYPHKSWKYFIWIDYPNKESWSRFNKRKSSGEIGRDATIGGEVGIHGVPDGSDSMIDEKYNWTLGCISLKNEHIEDLYKSINSSTKVLIIH